MNRFQVAALAILTGALLSAAPFASRPISAQVKTPEAVQKWEYKVHQGSAREREFNALGEQGWELCESASTAIFVFKRPKR